MAVSITASVFTSPSLLTKSGENAFKLTPAQQKKKEEADALVNQLRQVKQSLTSDRKATAKQKLDQAKEKLRMLRLMGGDPRQIARQAAQIAREIRGAAQEYTSALRDSASAVASAVPSSTPVAAAENGEAANVAPAGAQQPATPATATPEDIKKAYQDAASASAIKGAEARIERENLRDFKDAAREAKRLIEEAARKLKQKKPGDSDAREAESAGRQMDNAVTELGKAVSEYLNPVASNNTGAAPVVAVGETAPSVSLLI